MDSCLCHPKSELVLTGEGRTHAVNISLREIIQARVEIHHDCLTSFHVNTLEAKQDLQRDAILPCTWWLHEAKHYVVSVDNPCVRYIDLVLDQWWCCEYKLTCSIQVRVMFVKDPLPKSREWTGSVSSKAAHRRQAGALK